MAVYVIGDVQGCFRTFERLLTRIAFDAARDRLWMVGDLVNRGPGSLEVLRWMRAHEASVTCVLGNHDLHLLARAAGVVPPRTRDTLGPVLSAPDREELLEWLVSRPIFHREGGFVLVHAGLLPSWTLAEAERRARAAEAALRGPERVTHLAALGALKGGRERLPEGLAEPVETMAIVTRVRMVDERGRVRLAYKGPPEHAPGRQVPWYAFEGRRSTEDRVLFGHWAALGVRFLPSAVALDAGCAWGRELAALRLDDEQVLVEPCADRIEARDPT